MCGLCGIAGFGIIRQDTDIMRELLYVTALRGTDGTGVFSLTNSGKEALAKDAVPSARFINVNHKMFNVGWPDLMMGHCRDATVGSLIQSNTHPFVTPNLVGAHNGTLWDIEFNPVKQPGKDKETDSELMFKKMSRDGIQKTLSKLSPGSKYAVTIWDRREKELIFARNPDRKLFVALNKKRDVIYWASEEEMLDLILRRNKIEYECFYFETYKMYSISLRKIKAGSQIDFTVTPYGHKTWDMYKEYDVSAKSKPDITTSGMSDLVTQINKGKTTSSYEDSVPWHDTECGFCTSRIMWTDVARTYQDASGTARMVCFECDQRSKKELENLESSKHKEVHVG